MQTLISSWEWCNPPSMSSWVEYEYTRSGSDMKYRFKVHAYCNDQYGWYNNNIGAQIYVNGATSYSDRGWIKGQTSGAIGYIDYTWTSSWITVSNKTSGTVSFKVEICDGGGGGWRWRVDSTKTANCAVSPAASSMGTNVAGTTLSGPTVNVTKYDSSFVDNITISYNNGTSTTTITRNNFTSSQLTFTEAERLSIFQAQGGSTTKSWSVSGTTYSGGTSLGTFSGSVNITTESLVTARSCDDFNVGSNTIVYTNNSCGGKYAIGAYLTTSDRSAGTNVIATRSNLTTTGDDWWTMNMSDCAGTIYSSNTTSKGGKIYYRIFTYLGSNDTLVGYNDYECNYTFLQSECGPSITSFKYKVGDFPTKDIMGTSTTPLDYTNTTDLNKFIKGKTTLQIYVEGSAQSPATLSEIRIEVPGQSNVYASSTSGEQTLNTEVLTESGTLYAVVKDSRGFEIKLPITYVLNDYYQPTFTALTAIRNAKSAVDATADMIVKISTEISVPSYMATFIMQYAQQGTAYYIKFEYSTDGINWTTNSTSLLPSAVQSGSTITVTNYATSKIFDQDTQYYLRLVTVDYYNVLTHTTTTSNSVIVPISAPLISRRNKMIGINKVPTSATLDIGGNMHADTYISAGSYIIAGTNVTAGTYINANTLKINSKDIIWYESD